ncbi:MAG: FliM/FliN family flagellar motor switch protein [Planctomycetaceae bacterium]|nr:FliM/FliN family flagellar motor switch protein [Planctomycetaceae bacterium]
MDGHDQPPNLSISEVDGKLHPDQISIPLTFELGETVIPLSSFFGLQPGYVFELSSDVRNLVAIKVNGASIGHGELVQIGERIGVRITEVSSNAGNAS